MDTLTADPSTAALLAAVTAHVKSYMSHYDASHDFAHIQRVLGLSRHLFAHYQPIHPPSDSSPAAPSPDPLVTTLAALLHDVGDKKYLLPDQDPATLVQTLLLSLSCPPQLAARVQTVCAAVSWSGEQADPSRVAALLPSHPELAIVQDADRLDALGAVGLARTFAFGGARGRGLEDTLAHFEEKLLRVEGRMKTAEGRRMARERSRRLRVFREWWVEEDGVRGEVVGEYGKGGEGGKGGGEEEEKAA